MLSVMYFVHSQSQACGKRMESCGRLTSCIKFSHSIITNELIHLSITRGRKEILADS